MNWNFRVYYDDVYKYHHPSGTFEKFAKMAGPAKDVGCARYTLLDGSQVVFCCGGAYSPRRLSRFVGLLVSIYVQPILISVWEIIVIPMSVSHANAVEGPIVDTS